MGRKAEESGVYFILLDIAFNEQVDEKGLIGAGFEYLPNMIVPRSTESESKHLTLNSRNLDKEELLIRVCV
jgi:hypothetical protein